MISRSASVTLLFFTLLVIGLGAVVWCADPAGNDEKGAPELPGFVVVLKDGTSLAVLSEPVIAFGKVRFQDAESRTRVLSASKVDLDMTREINSTVPSRRAGGTVSVSGNNNSKGTTRYESGGSGGSGASASKKVTVYSATWCPHCRDLEDFLKKNRIRATVIMVDRMPEQEQLRLQAKMQGLTGRVAFPTIVIGSKARAGFSPEWILSTLGLG
jgi:glutaredoxin